MPYKVRTTEVVQATDGTLIDSGSEGYLLTTSLELLGNRGCDVRLEDGRVAYLLMPSQYNLIVVQSPSGTPIDRADDWVCICGNHSGLDGFYPCNAGGYEVEPNALWSAEGDIYCCAKCGRIIDGRTGELRGMRGADAMG